MSFRQIILTFIINILITSLFAQDSLNILHYDIHLKINTQEETISGYTSLTLTACRNLDNITLYLWGPSTDSLFINNTKSTQYTTTSNQIIINYPIDKNDTAIITVYYHGHTMTDPHWGGFYFKNGYAYNYGIGMHSQPFSLGRTWFPTDDSFTDKATFDFHITTTKTQKAICNGLLIDSTLSRHTITWHWRLSEPIPPYLANVAVGRYKKFTWTYHGLEKDIPVEIYLFHDTPDSAIKSFTHLDTVMHIFEKLFGPYPWPRIGYVQTPMQAGAMEHVTNISMPYFAINGTLDNEDLIYHELSHSWFGNLVTCATPHDMWLNEGWASYAESLYKQYLYDSSAFAENVRYNHLIVLNFAHKQDNGYKAIGKIDYNNTYGTTIYKKGADVVHMLRYQIGDSLFWPAIRHYLSTFAWKNATIDDLRLSLDQYTHLDLENFFNFWIYSPGFPLLYIDTVSVQKTGTNHYKTIIRISQRLIATHNYLKGQRLQVAFVGNDNQFAVRETFINGKNTIDTFTLNFKPVTLFLDPYDHLLDASTDQYYWVNKPGMYLFDYELFDVNIQSLAQPFFLRVKANWIAPRHTLIQNNRYLLNSTYYWTVQSNVDNINAEAKLYLSSLMDLNFRRLTEKQLKGLRIFYRSGHNQPWQIISSRLSNNYNYLLINQLKPGDYIIGFDRMYMKD